MTSWGPLDVPLDPLGPPGLGTPMSSLDPLYYLYYLTNHQGTYQMSPLNPWDTLEVSFDPLGSLRGHHTKPDYQETSWSIRLLHSFPFGLV